MPAHLLDAARVVGFNNVYRLGEHQQPITIRDQLNRSFLVVGEMMQRGLITKDSPLLVVGAGVAGVTATARALRYGCHVDLIERAPEPFDTQLNCTTRKIEPFGNDWPHVHFDRIIPAGGISLLEFGIGDADEVAANWNNQFNELRKTYEHDRKLLSFRPDVYFEMDGGAIDIEQVGERIQYKPDGKQYGAVLLCTGFGKPNCTVGKYVGFDFWLDDPLGDDNCGFDERIGKVDVLVSGGGYGGLQDFVRCLIGNVALSDVFNRISIPSDVRIRLGTAYEAAYRKLVTIGLGHSLRHSMWQPLRDEIDAAVAELKRSYIWAPLMTQIASLIPPDRPRVYLAHSCRHFGESFVGWRFLVRLLADHLRERPTDRYDPLIANVHVAGVKCIGHAAGDPWACHGKAHEVTFVHNVCGKPKESKTGRPFVFHGVVIRHGPKSGAVPRVFQALPFKIG